jgi:hypothetical protein
MRIARALRERGNLTKNLIWLPEAKGHGIQLHELAIRLGAFLSHPVAIEDEKIDLRGCGCAFSLP